MWFGAFVFAAAGLLAQFLGGAGPESELIRQAIQLDLEGRGREARQVLQKAIDSSGTEAARANARRAMAMSWAFESNCGKTGEYEQMVVDYWITREKEEPHNAFYQEGEMADEAARVCIDAGDLDAAFHWYETGQALGLKEPDISDDRKALWDFRWEHAQARISSRRGNRTGAEKHVAAAKAALDGMTVLRRQQVTFFPYLTGYVAFYLGDYKKALVELQQADQRDPFIQCLLGQTYEKLGDPASAMECYRKASMTNAHNPPAAYARPFARKKLGDAGARSRQHEEETYASS
jgi:tetratricopeptide (TPR) repeat protein